jgi:hypothetical protein
MNASSRSSSVDNSTITEIFDRLLTFNPKYGAIICKPCQYAIVPKEINTHLRKHHREEEGITFSQIRDVSAHCLSLPTRLPDWIKDMYLHPTDTPAIPFLRVYQDAYACRLCQCIKPFVGVREDSIVRHLKTAHNWSRSPGAQSAVKLAMSGLHSVATFPVACQTFFRRNVHLRYFQVQEQPTASMHQLATGNAEGVQPLSIAEQIELQLEEKTTVSESATCSRRPGQRHFSQVSPWLDTTQWPRYLHGHNLLLAAQLIDLPGASHTARNTVVDERPKEPENHLVLLIESFDRVIEQARQSLLEDKINVFDKHRVNSFIPRRSSSRPIWHKLQETTYRTYKKVWKQLLCFVYRMVWKRHTPVLHCVLTPAQSTALENVLQAVASFSRHREGDLSSAATETKLRIDVNKACLLFCIRLLDHQLHGNIYDSPVVGFLAVLGINPQGSYREATTYTTSLSAFVKIAQLLVVQRVVLAVEEDEVDHIADVLEVMQDRFMVYGTRSPMNWALKLRAYGKKIQDTTTGLGSIIWSDDGEDLTYKGLELRMTALKRFVAHGVEMCQTQLHELLLVNPEEDREDVVPALNLRALKDDPTASQPGWSFLKDSRNIYLHGRERWLLNRVASSDWLQDEFLLTNPKNKTKAKWRRKAVDCYLSQVDRFLHRLLLLIHLTGGQRTPRASSTIRGPWPIRRGLAKISE